MSDKHSTEQLEAEAKSLLDRFLYEGEDDAELLETLGKLPDDKCLYERGMAAFFTDKPGAMDYLKRAMLEDCHAIDKPPSSNTLYYRWIVPSNLVETNTEFWNTLADALGLIWPDSPAHLLLKAYVAFWKANTEKAEKLLANCLDLDEGYWLAASELSEIYVRKGEWKVALHYFEQAILHAPDKQKPGFCAGTVRCFDELDDRDEAIRYFAELLDEDDKAWWAADALSEIYYSSKNWKASLVYAEQTVEVAAKDDEVFVHVPRLYFCLAWCCCKVGDRRAEQDAYRECLKLAPDYEYAKHNLGWSLLRTKDYEEAEDVFREAMQLDIGKKNALRGLAATLRRLGRYAEAIELHKQDIYRGKLTKPARRRIAELETLIERHNKGEEIPEADDVKEEEPDMEGPRGERVAKTAPEPGEEQEPTIDAGRKKRKKKQSSRMTHESELEAGLERKIDRGEPVFERRLRMFEPEDSKHSKHGRYGRQYAIPGGIGIIDLLTIDLDTNELVVIELKRDKPGQDIVGQLMKYMAWVRVKLADEGQGVRGIICVWGAAEWLREIVPGMPDVEMFEYDLNFTKS